MLQLRFRHGENAAGGVVDTARNGSIIVGRRILRRWCCGIAVVASIVALLAISQGFATAGIAIYVAAILPFAFFS